MKHILILILMALATFGNGQTQLKVPDTLSGTSINLLLHKDSVDFLSGPKTNTFGFNANKYLGPTIILNNGSEVSITVDNQIGDTTTIHWHGLHVAPINDGGPHTIILPNEIWNPKFMVLNNAASFWYHPHLMHSTAKQTLKGAAGIIIVRDKEERLLNIPRTYGVDDFPLIIQTQQFDSMNQVMERGMEDSLILVNGARANYGYSVYANFPAQVIRLRLLNASGERNYNFGLTGNKIFKIIGSDGGLLNASVSTTRVRLAPGERSEILVDLTGMAGQTINLLSYASEIPMGVQGGPTMPMPPGTPPMDSPLNGIDFNIMKIDITAPTANPIMSIPTTLVNVIPYTEGQAHTTRVINFTADSAMVMDGPFYFNDQLFDMHRIDYRIPLNNIEIWQLVNQTMVAHPFHIHDIQFYILDRDGNAPPLEERGRKDVVLVNPKETIRFITKFEDFADTVIPYMYHCHILMHEDDGMMGQFVVVPPPTVGIKENSIYAVTIYPNPASSTIKINFQENLGLKDIRIYNVLGEMVFIETKNTDKELQINLGNWTKGVYTVQINANNQLINKKLILN